MKSSKSSGVFYRLLLDGYYDNIKPITISKKDIGYFFAALIILAGLLVLAAVLFAVVIQASDCGNACPSLFGAFASELSDPSFVGALASGLILVVAGIYLMIRLQKHGS
jgi:hypothetical protein